MSQDVLAYLQSKGLPFKQAGGYEVCAPCPFHNETPGKQRPGRLYINVDPNADVKGLYYCHVCEASGNLTTLKKHYGDTIAQEEEDTLELLEIRRLAAAFYIKQLSRHDNVVDYLRGPERGLADETIRKFKIGYAPQALKQDMGSGEITEIPTRSLYSHLKDLGYGTKEILATGLCVETKSKSIIDSLAGMITIPYLVAGQVVDIRGRTFPNREDRPKYKTCSGNASRLFNTDAVWNIDDAAREVVATEGEFDCMVMTQLGYRAVGLPGAVSWQESWLDYFRDIQRVWIIFDRDKAGTKGAQKVLDGLDGKGRLVFLSELGQKIDPTEWVAQGHTAEDFQALLDAARKGGLLVTVREAREEFDEIQSQPGLKFGWEALDFWINPGLQRGQLMIPLAKTGCLTGDTEIAVNRAGKGFRIQLADMYDRWSGKRYAWNLSTPTMVQRADDGVVRLGQVSEVWDSGVKPVYELRTIAGRSVKATAEHPFMTPEGWKKLGELEVGAQVFVNAGRSTKGRTEKSHYFIRSGLVHHPHRGRRSVKAGGNSVPLHRLVAEASINGMELDDFLARCRLGPVEGLGFLDPGEWAVHHIDHDPFNNDLGNLKIMSHVDHAALHAEEGTARNVLEQVGTDEIVSITYVGEEQTYDISMVDEPHNFMANGFVSHNTGKTILMLNMMDSMRRVESQEDLKMLFVSLEQTRGEWWDRARRIYRLNHLDQTDDECERWWSENMMLVDRNQLSISDLHQVLDDFQYRWGKPPDLMAVDYLGYWAQGFKGGDRYQRVSDAVMALKGIAKDMRIPVICPHQVSRIGQDGEEFGSDGARDSGVIEETADYVFTMWALDNKLGREEDQKQGQIHMRIAKSRHGGRGQLLKFQWAPLSLVMAPEGSKLCAFGRREMVFQRDYRDDWERAVYRHITGVEGHLEDVPDINDLEQLQMEDF